MGVIKRCLESWGITGAVEWCSFLCEMYVGKATFTETELVFQVS